jgi:hypothetical protein
MPGTLTSFGVSPSGVNGCLEQFIKGILAECSGLCIDRLVVRRTPEGVCLDGVIRMSEDTPDPADLVRAATGIGEVLNRLVVFREASLAPPEREAEDGFSGVSGVWQG